jgi:hypothetical protein
VHSAVLMVSVMGDGGHVMLPVGGP